MISFLVVTMISPTILVTIGLILFGHFSAVNLVRLSTTMVGVIMESKNAVVEQSWHTISSTEVWKVKGCLGGAKCAWHDSC